MSVIGVFLVRISPHPDWIGRDTPYFSIFSPNAGKYGPEKLPTADIFHAVRFPQNLGSRLKFQKTETWFGDETEMITTSLISSCHWKTFVPFCLRKKRRENTFLKPTVNCRKIKQKNNLCDQIENAEFVEMAEYAECFNYSNIT